MQNTAPSPEKKRTNYRWVICSMLFFATTINYLDRQALSLTWKDFIAPEFHWTNEHYGIITGVFSLAYAVAILFFGPIIDWLGTKRGYLWAVGIWSVGACTHAFCGMATEWWVGLESAADLVNATGAVAVTISTVSVYFFLIARAVLAIGEAGNFPVAIKTTAEYFPKKDRAFATGLFNTGSMVGALGAPFTIPTIADKLGWEAAFLIIGASGFLWMGFWQFLYKKPEKNPKVNAEELAYINQDEKEEPVPVTTEKEEKKLSFLKCFTFRQTWAFALGKFMSDGVWWFFLFWMPAYLSSVYGMESSDLSSQLAIGALYTISMLSIFGGYLPTIFVEKRKMNPYEGRMKAMLIFAFFPLLVLLAQPLGQYSYWFPVVIIGIAAAAHQSWSANIYSTVSDMFPKSAVASIIGIGSMAGGASSFLINVGSGKLFDYAETTQLELFQFKGIEAGYMIIFSICSVSYLIGWCIMKLLVPRYKLIEIEKK